MKALFSISLAILVLFASIGMAKTTHFCMGHAMKSDIGFSPEHLDCGMAMDMGHDENVPNPENKPQSCCENITEHLQVDDDVHLKKHHYSFNLDFAVALVQVFVFGTGSNSIQDQTVTTFLPPPPSQDLHVLYEIFLI